MSFRVRGEYTLSCLNLTAAPSRPYITGQEAQFRGSDFPKVSVWRAVMETHVCLAPKSQVLPCSLGAF